MRIHVTMRVDGEDVKQDWIEIADHKLEELTEEEIQGAIEIKVSEWANRVVLIEWEREEEV